MPVSVPLTCIHTPNKRKIMETVCFWLCFLQWLYVDFKKILHASFSKNQKWKKKKRKKFTKEIKLKEKKWKRRLIDNFLGLYFWIITNEFSLESWVEVKWSQVWRPKTKQKINKLKKKYSNLFFFLFYI